MLYVFGVGVLLLYLVFACFVASGVSACGWFALVLLRVLAMFGVSCDLCLIGLV